MEVNKKTISTELSLDSLEEEKTHEELNQLMSEHKKVKRLIDYFILGLFLTYIFYTFAG